jgi:hypothetical protein
LLARPQAREGFVPAARADDLGFQKDIDIARLR